MGNCADKSSVICHHKNETKMLKNENETCFRFYGQKLTQNKSNEYIDYILQYDTIQKFKRIDFMVNTLQEFFEISTN